MIAIALDLEPGQIINLETGGARYAIARAPEALPQAIDSGRSLGFSHSRGRYQARQLPAPRGGDLPGLLEVPILPGDIFVTSFSAVKLLSHSVEGIAINEGAPLMILQPF